MPIWVQFRLSVAIEGKIRVQTRPKAANAPKSAPIRGEHTPNRPNSRRPKSRRPNPAGEAALIRAARSGRRNLNPN